MDLIYSKLHQCIFGALVHRDNVEIYTFLVIIRVRMASKLLSNGSGTQHG